MEKQKIFWVILSVTVFVVVVLVVGLFLLKKAPAASNLALRSTSAGEPSGTGPAGIYEFGRDASSSGGDTEVLRFVIGGDGTEARTGEAAPAAPAAPMAPPAAPTAPAAPLPAPAAAPRTPPASRPAAPAPARKPATAVRTSEYWIQTGSYKSQSRAEELSRTLAAKGLAGRVFSFSKTDETYFRVRIGPYTNKQEAEKFLAIVQKIQGLEASYISQVAAVRSAN